MEKPSKPTLKQKIVALSETRMGHGLLAALALVFAYTFATRAIDTGSTLDWAITFMLLLIAARETAGFARATLRNK